MRYPNFNEEKILWRQGFKYVVGLDEAGRGPLAGPVVAAAVLIKPGRKFLLQGIHDSKMISEKKRDYFYKILTNHPQIEWGIGIVSEKVIDQINILEATKLAMLTAIEDLKCDVDHLILDGNFKISSEITQKSIIKADEKVFSCTAAGIIAKVTRDRIMQKYDKKYPEYGFKKHKGYPTLAHRKILHKIGPCLIHRKSFSYQNLSTD
jgi:ribonuclease HII